MDIKITGNLDILIGDVSKELPKEEIEHVVSTGLNLIMSELSSRTRPGSALEKSTVQVDLLREQSDPSS
jgi:hypothetical protein